MIWTDDALLRGLEGELYVLYTATSDVTGEFLTPDNKIAAYILCMGLIRVAAIVEKLSPARKAEYPDVPWEDVRSVGNHCARYPLSADVAELAAFVEATLPDFYEQVMEMIADCGDDMPY